MKYTEVEGTTFVRDYRSKFSRLDRMLALLCSLGIAFFVLKLAGLI